ncbi:MAG: PAS domain S-box protein, partial [Methanobacterium sp.]|nr:PAS domain S-box protein [Methanobacterium sp.]
KISPDLILLDIVLKGELDGINAAQKIQELNIPVIFLTAHSDDEAVERAKETEPYGYLVKPYDPVDLKNTVEFAIYKHAMYEKLKKSEKKYRNIIENLQDAYIRADNGGTIIMASPSAARMFKYSSPDEMIGQSVLNIYNDPDTRNLMLEKLNKHLKLEGYEFEGLRKDGTTFWLSMNSQPYHDQDKIMGVESFLRDITESKESEKNIQKLYRLYATLSQINQAVVRIKDQESFFKIICNVCVEFGKFKMAWIGSVDETTGKVTPIEHAGYEAGYLETVNVNVNILNSPSNRAMKSKKFVLIKDVREELNKSWVKEAQKRDYNSMAVIPIKLKTRLIAMLYIYSSEINFFTDEELDLIREMAMDISFAITTLNSINEHKLLSKALIESEESYRELVDNSIVAIYKTNLDGNIIFANQAMADFFGFKSKHELLNVNVKTLYMDPEDRKQLINQLRIDGSLIHREVEMVSKTGKKINILLSAKLTGTIISGMMMDISQLKEVEAELKNSENKFRALVENASDALYLHDFNGNFVDVNKSACESLGYSRDELLHMNVVDVDTDFDLESAKTVWKNIMPGSPLTIYSHQVRKDGTVFPVEISFAIVDIDGKRLYMGLCRDITQRIESEKVLKDSEEKYHSIFDYSRDAIILSALGKNVTDVNPAAKELFGYSKEEFMDMTGKDLLDPDEINADNLLKDLETNKFYKGELNLRNKNGSMFTAELLSSVYYDSAGNEKSVTQIRDITPRKMAEEQVKKSENRYRKVGKLISDFAFSCVENQDGMYQIEWITDSFYNITGFSKPELYEHGCWVFTVHPDDEKIAFNQLNRLKPGMKRGENFRIVTNKGKIMWLENHLECVEDEGRLRLYGAAKDITEIERAVSKLRLNEEKLKAIINNSSDLIRILDKNRKIVFDSPSSTRILGYPEGSLVGSDPLDFIHPEDREKVRADIEEVFEKRNPGTPSEFRILMSDGNYLPVESIAQNMFDVPSVNGVVVTTHPIRERKEMENAIKSSLKDKEILLKEIHHRVKNNMQIISSLLNLQKEYVDDFEAINVLQESQNRVKTMSLIHEKLYQSDDLTHINIQEYVEKLVKDLLYSYAVTDVHHTFDIKKIKMNIETALPCGLIISELVSNSLKYAYSNNNKDKELEISIKKFGDLYELSVSDNGVGFPENLDFKNTESLGLQLVNNLVGQLEGEITLDKNHGTKFKIIFKELQYKARI